MILCTEVTFVYNGVHQSKLCVIRVTYVCLETVKRFLARFINDSSSRVM